ncbi:MAG: HD domain-containing protein [Candidatus Bathyarchaeaceae archaeon]
MNRRHIVIDPIHGNIEMPRWLVRIKDEPSIRRMMNIKQLGLKAFIDFPGAIHTRYLHSLGTMHLAGKLIDLLIEKEKTRGRLDLIENLTNNKNSLMAAGFFHDIGHGPFSHVFDFVLEKSLGTDHEEIATKIVKSSFKDILEEDSIPADVICQIIKGEHKYPFLGEIINDAMDVDKVDYLIRDSYFVGLRYGFDLDHFLRQITVCGVGEKLEEYRLVLENTLEAKVSAELFVLIRKALYDLVYHVESSRIAEKMLEKAVLVAIETDEDFKSEMSNLESYMQISEYDLFEGLRQIKKFPGFMVDRILRGDLYLRVFNEELANFNLNEDFIESLRKHDFVSEVITQKLGESESKPYSVICDIIRTKVPKEIFVDELDEEGEPLPIKSGVIDSLRKEEISIKVYVEPKKKRKVAKEIIKSKIQEIIDGWEKGET